MNTQSEALRLADELEGGAWIAQTSQWKEEAAAELRRLHQSEYEGWRYSDELEQERKRLHELNQEMGEALDGILDVYDAMGNPRGPARIIADAALAKAAGEQS